MWEEFPDQGRRYTDISLTDEVTYLSVPSVPVEELKSFLEQIAGVVAARPVLDNSGALSGVHILARSDRGSKQIVRDIESACKAQFDLEIDHRIVSVAQVEEEDGYCITRLHSKSMNIVTSGGTWEVSVTLFSDDGREFHGQAKGPATADNRLRLTAQAALSAVEGYLHNMCDFILQDIFQTNFGTYTGVLASITIVTPHDEDELIGSAVVKTELWEAALKAVLDAVNRRVMTMVAI